MRAYRRWIGPRYVDFTGDLLAHVDTQLPAIVRAMRGNRGANAHNYSAIDIYLTDNQRIHIFQTRFRAGKAATYHFSGPGLTETWDQMVADYQHGTGQTSLPGYWTLALEQAQAALAMA